MHKIHILFVCHKNHTRSRFFESYFNNHMNHKYKALSAGTHGGRLLTPVLIQWADRVYVMDHEQGLYILANYPQFSSKVKTLNIPDIYHPGDKKLIPIIKDFIKREGL